MIYGPVANTGRSGIKAVVEIAASPVCSLLGDGFITLPAGDFVHLLMQVLPDPLPYSAPLGDLSDL